MFRKGFTLVELAIVLVIIGLLVGGVLAGQELIKQAKIRKTLAEFQNMDRAFKTFVLKYNGLPGDLKNSRSFFPVVCNGTKIGRAADLGTGNGNGYIGDIEEEGFCAPGQLLASGLYTPIAHKKDYYGSNVPSADIDLSAGDADYYMGWPVDKSAAMGFFYLEPGNTAYSIRGNTLIIAGMDWNGYQPFFTSQEAYELDMKIDNGKPYGKDFSGITMGIPDADPGCYTNDDQNNLPTPQSEYDLSVKKKACVLIYKIKA